MRATPSRGSLTRRRSPSWWGRPFSATTTPARAVLHAPGYVGRALSPSRFSRRIHALADWLALLLDVLGDLFAHGQAVICDVVIDRMPVPVCKRVRARRCRTVRGREYCGYGPAKDETFFG